MKNLFIVVIGLSLLAGCTSKRQQQDAANAIAGVEATEQLAADLAPADQALFGVIASGIKANVAATAQTKQADLPAPEMAPASILANADEYKAKADQAEKDATAGIWKQILGWGGGALALAIGVLRFVPGAHAPIVNLVHSVLESRKDKKTREREEGLANGARVMMDVIEAYAPKGVKEAIARKVSPQAKEAIDSYLSEINHGN